MLKNVIIWNNQANGSTTSTSASINNNSSTPTISHSLVANSGGSGSWDSGLGTDGGNNIDVDPKFVTDGDPSATPPTAGDYRLQDSSPAINVGDNDADLDADGPGTDKISDIETDLAGNARIQGDIIDMGAYEGGVVGTTPPPGGGGNPPPGGSAPVNQPPQLDRPIPDVTVTEGAADQTLNMLDYFSDPESDLLYFTIMANSKREVVPSALVGQRLNDLLTLKFGTPGQTEIIIQAEEDVHHKTYQDSFIVTVLERPQPTLSMSQSVSDNEVKAGQEVTYTLTISNSGPGTATNARISDTLPAYVTFMSDSIRATGLNVGTVGNTPPLLAEGVTMMPDEVLEISFAARVNDDVLANQMISNTAQLTATEVITPILASSMITVITPTLDIDNDGVNSDVENQVPNLNGEGRGDGNGDGMADNEQKNVASLPNGTNGEYVTFVVADELELVNVKTQDNPARDDMPLGVNLTQGFFDFSVTGQEAGQSVVVTLISHTQEGENLPNSYWKYGPTPDNTTAHWYLFNFDAESGTGAQINGNTITLHFVDGERGDDDLTANGQIKDPGAPAIYTAPTAITLTQLDAQGTSNWLLIVSGLLTLLALGALRWRRR